MTRLAILAAFGLLCLLAVGPAAPTAKPAAAFSLDKRVPLTTSRVVGSPDPAPPFRTKRVFADHKFDKPVHVASNPAFDLLFVVEQAGRIVCLPPSGKVAPREFLKIPDHDAYGMTFHPAFAKNRLVYVFANGPNSKPKKNNRILRYRVLDDPPRCDVKSETPVIEWESNGHNGGDLAFGRDGMLYITSGDGTSDSDTDNTGQDLKDLCSGMIRIDVDKPDKGRGYSIPADNPFIKTPGARGELWAFGFRNPWRMTFHPVSGECLVGDVGQDVWEMIRLVTKGSNHGWSVTEGSAPFYPERKLGPAPVSPPLIEHPHSESRSITGGVVYRGKRLPALRDVYVYGDYSTGKYWGLKLAGGKVSWKGDIAWSRTQPVGFGTDRDGELYIADYAGQIHTLEPSPPGKDHDKFPRTLTETGLYASVKDHRHHPGVIPYGVNSPFWSDGAFKERFIALPGSETVGFSEDGAWKFPDKTVLVKTFSVDRPDRTKRRIETRLMTLQEGEWVGYSYKWRDDQSDADLVGAGGTDATYDVRDDKGVKSLKWHYPSRVECMVCHTRAANYVLGVCTNQLNGDFDYGGVKRNQLTALERLGVFKVPKEHHRQATVDAVALRMALTGTNAPAAATLGAVSAAVGKKAAVGDSSHLAKPVAAYPALPSPWDATASAEKRARSYLHANCAYCHVWAGGGNAAILLDWKTSLDKTLLVGVTPLHDKFGIDGAKLVAPGEPEKSVLYQRLTRRGKGQMPPLASSCIDEKGAEVIREWIVGMKK